MENYTPDVTMADANANPMIEPYMEPGGAVPMGIDEELLDENTAVIDGFVQTYLNGLEMSKTKNDQFLQTATMKACTQDLDTCASKLGVELEIPSPP